MHWKVSVTMALLEIFEKFQHDEHLFTSVVNIVTESTVTNVNFKSAH